MVEDDSLLWQYQDEEWEEDFEEDAIDTEEELYYEQEEQELVRKKQLEEELREREQRKYREMLSQKVTIEDHLLSQGDIWLKSLEGYLSKYGQLSPKAEIVMTDNLVEFNEAVEQLDKYPIRPNKELIVLLLKTLPLLRRTCMLKSPLASTLYYAMEQVGDYLKRWGYPVYARPEYPEGIDEYYEKNPHMRKWYPEYYKPKYPLPYNYASLSEEQQSKYEQIRKEKMKEALRFVEEGTTTNWLYEPFDSTRKPDLEKSPIEKMAETSVRLELFGKPTDIEDEKKSLQDVYEAHNEEVAKWAKNIIEKDRETEKLTESKEELSPLGKLAKEFIKREGKEEY